LLDQPKIIERRRALGKPLLEKNMVTAERVINELAKIAFSDIKDYLSFRTEKVECDKPETDENNQQTMYKYKIIIETKDGKEVDGTVINEVSLSKDGTFKFKLYDKLSALEKLGKTLGIFVEKIEHSGKLEMPDIIIGK
jgi:phage terminase small subunit